jgi:hypothetical protein
MQDKSAQIDMTDLVNECKVLYEKRLLLFRDDQWIFRHDRIRDYVIALSLDKEGALGLRHDSRFAGVFEFLPKLLSDDDANELGEVLRDEAATTGNNTVWLKYKQNWRLPDACSKIDGFVMRAIVEFQKKRPAEEPRYETIGARAFAAVENGFSPIDLTDLEAERDSLLAANIFRDRDGRIEFRTDELRDYFLAMSLDKDRAFEIRTDKRFFGAFEFLPKFLSRDHAKDLGQKLKDDHLKQGRPKTSAWHRYKKHWRGPKKAGE